MYLYPWVPSPSLGQAWGARNRVFYAWNSIIPTPGPFPLFCKKFYSSERVVTLRSCSKSNWTVLNTMVQLLHMWRVYLKSCWVCVIPFLGSQLGLNWGCAYWSQTSNLDVTPKPYTKPQFYHKFWSWSSPPSPHMCYVHGHSYFVTVEHWYCELTQSTRRSRKSRVTQGSEPRLIYMLIQNLQ